MSAATIPWEQYQQLPPDQRRRPLTDAEYAALTKQQRIAAGLEDDDQGAPANFNGPVFPNPDHIQPHADTDPAIEPTRLPQGVTFQGGNWSGTPQMDISNPAAADVQPEMGREVGTQMSAQPIDFSKYEQGAPPGGQQIDFSKYEPGATKTQQGASSIDEQDRATTEAWAQNHPILGPIARFLVAGGQNAGHAITDTPGQLYHAIVDPPTMEESELGLKPEQRIAYRLGLKQAIEAGTDYASGKVTPKGAASVLPEALGTGVGQVAGGAVYGKTGEIAGKVLPIVTEAATRALESPGGQAAKAAVSAAAKKLPAAAIKRIPYVGPVLSDVYKAGSEAAAEARAAAEPEAAASAEPTATEEPAQPLPKPKAKTVKQSTALGPNAQVQNQAEALGPRTIVTDPATGRPEFSDVVAAKQAAPPETKGEPAPVETKAVTTETPPIGEQAVAKGTPAETPGPAADDLLERLKGVADRIQKQETSAPGSADEDLVQQAQDSLDMVRARKAAGITRQPEMPAGTEEEFKQRLSAIADRKAAQAAGKTPGGALETVPEPGAGVMTTAAPKDLLGRWGVDEDSFAQGREQTRGMKPDESAAAIAKLKKAYQNGQAVEPVMETRDAGNNIVDVDGRGRALAAHQAGVERIPIVVRRMPAEAVLTR